MLIALKMERTWFALFPLVVRRRQRDVDMSKLVKFEMDPVNPPALTEAQEQELQALEAMGDQDIDFSDIPPTSDSLWLNARRNPYYRPVKQQLTLRLDADVVAWFRKHAKNGRGYQSNINQALREYVEAREGEAG